MMRRFQKTAGLWGLAVVLLIAAACHVRGSQEYYLTVGDTMVVPCLAELWSDQSYSCAIGNPNVLMLDGSGRAVIAIGGGTSELFVHVDNPDVDVQYTFIVLEPETRYEETLPGTDWFEPDAQAAGNAGAGTNASGQPLEPGSGQGAGRAGEENGSGGAAGSDGTAAGSSHSRGGSVNGTGNGSASGREGGGNGAGDENARGQGAGRNGIAGAGDGAATGQGAGNGAGRAAGTAGGGNRAETGADSHGMAAGNGSFSGFGQGADGIGAGDGSGQENGLAYPAQVPMPKESASPFWENPAEGGIIFERMFSRDASDSDAPDMGNGYTACVRILSDGEVRPVFVSVGGREVRWKYSSGILYVNKKEADGGAVRGGALDCNGEMYYFSL